MITQESLVGSDYEGWVAWVNGVEGDPLFEMVPPLAGLGFAPLTTGAQSRETRREERNVLDWKNVPGEKVDRFELYFARDVFPNQPVFRGDRQPGSSSLRFIQMKMTGAVIHTSPGATRPVERLGILGYKVGVWIPENKDCQLWEITRSGVEYLGKRISPTAPRPEGFGLNPATMGE